MKITLDLALSVDGFIAKLDGDSDWVAPNTESIFKNRVKEAGCLVVGRKTFEQYKDNIYPVDDALNIVISSGRHDSDYSNVEYASSPEEAVSIAKEKGISKIILAGGGTVSGAFLGAGLIDEVYFSIHPLLLVEGIKPFEGINKVVKLALLDYKDLGDGITQLHYSVLKD